MEWELILEYEPFIKRLAYKYCQDSELVKDVTQEVMLRLKSDKTLDINNFREETRAAAIRTTIRNKILKVLGSKSHGKLPASILSLDQIKESLGQVDSSGNFITFIRPTHTNTIGDLDDRDNDYYDGLN